MKIELKRISENELGILNVLYEFACKYFDDIGQEIRSYGNSPKKALTEGILPPNGTMENYVFYSIYLGDEIIGYFDYYLGFPNDDTVYISFVFIKDEYRGNGYAKEIILDFCDKMGGDGFKYIRLTVQLKNWNALKFWYKLGFSKIASLDIQIEEQANFELVKELND